MPTIFGDQGPVFGLKEETTGFAQSFNQKYSFEKANVENHTGTTKTTKLFNPKYEGSIELIAKTAGTMPVVGGLLTASNLATITSALITEGDRKPEQKGFEKQSFTYEAYVGVDYSTTGV
jgi:hypothetical protein